MSYQDPDPLNVSQTSQIQQRIEDLLRDLAELAEPEEVVRYVERLGERMRDELES